MTERVATVRATVRTWRHLGRTHRSFEDAGWTGYAPLEMPDTLERVTRVWLAGDRGREEGQDGEVFVWRGSDRWRYDPSTGARSNENVPRVSPHVSELEWLRGAAEAIGRLDLDPPVPCRRAGRAAQAVRGLPKAARDGELMPLGLEAATEGRLELDAERGTPLRIEARHGGEPFLIQEVLDIEFDETFPDDTFVFTPPPGVEIRSTLDDEPVRWGLTLEQATAAAPFTLWVPAEDWDVTVAYARMEAEPPTAPQVHLQYVATATRIAQSPVSHPGQQASIVLEGAGPWHVTERNGRRMEVREHEEARRPAQVCLELEGTWIDIHSWELDVHALADLAGGLRRAA